jgi:hypothetical protein
MNAAGKSKSLAVVPTEGRRFILGAKVKIINLMKR